MVLQEVAVAELRRGCSEGAPAGLPVLDPEGEYKDYIM